MEKLGVDYLSCLLNDTAPRWASELPKIWLEFERRQTPTAQLVHQLDAFECLQQAFIYKKRYRHIDLDEFKNLRLEITDKWLSDQADIILTEWTKLQTNPSEAPIIFVIGK